MNTPQNILEDNFGRKHTYLRLSVTERCNLRCTYCMPENGIALSPKAAIMKSDEIFTIAKTFVAHGVTKIRLTGGEPLIRKNIRYILKQLAMLPVELAITTNGVIVDKFIDTFKDVGLNTINISLDSLNSKKNEILTRRNYYKKVYANILLLIKEGFRVKLNCVLIKGFNDSEIVEFIELGKTLPVQIRFIEFMPFDGNQWHVNKLVSLETILKIVENAYPHENLMRLKDAKNDTAKNYKIKGYQGTFAIISSVTNPFCDSCNRIRLTANGQLKNCLFSNTETDLLTALRQGKPIAPIIKNVIQLKKKTRNGLETLEAFSDTDNHDNRSMITIGG